MEFKAFLFKLHDIKIDTLAIDCFVLLFNYYKGKGYNIEEKVRDIWKKVEFAKYNFPDVEFIYSMKSGVQVFQHKKEITTLKREDVIDSIHDVIFQRLTTSAVSVLKYIDQPELISKAYMQMTKEYKEYLINNYYILKVVNDFEQGKLKTFPSLKDILYMWVEKIYSDFGVSVK